MRMSDMRILQGTINMPVIVAMQQSFCRKIGRQAKGAGKYRGFRFTTPCSACRNPCRLPPASYDPPGAEGGK